MNQGRHGDFEQVVLPHLDAAYNLARWLTRNDHDAQDVAQEAVLRAYRFFDGLRGEAKPWLLAIVRNSCFTWLQANRPAGTVGFDDGIAELLPADDDGPEVQAARNCDRRTLNADRHFARAVPRGADPARARRSIVQRHSAHRRRANRNGDVASRARPPTARTIAEGHFQHFGNAGEQITRR